MHELLNLHYTNIIAVCILVFKVSGAETVESISWKKDLETEQS